MKWASSAITGFAALSLRQQTLYGKPASACELHWDHRVMCGGRGRRFQDVSDESRQLVLDENAEPRKAHGGALGEPPGSASKALSLSGPLRVAQAVSDQVAHGSGRTS